MGIVNYNEETIFHDQKSLFLPMFCRLSIKDVKLNTVPVSSAADPTSPRVSCMGQVKRNSRVTGYPSSTTIISHRHKHPNKPRKSTHFSTKILLPNPAAASGSRKSVSKSCRRDSRRPLARASFDQELCSVKAATALDISKMDPPLPVVKRAAAAEVNLWNRRFDGVKSMRIEPIHLPVKEFQLPAAAADDGTRYMK
ncbi:hypothetical protein AAHA92_33544 [Salvia divinorum]|uniref:Uncharacterized protein n=1 Tax=Salvia divinorum TaxID=28513 RepID=A0ABD1FPC7_SALDI